MGQRLRLRQPQPAGRGRHSLPGRPAEKAQGGLGRADGQQARLPDAIVAISQIDGTIRQFAGSEGIARLLADPAVPQALSDAVNEGCRKA
jgi:hypothetical protein